MVMDKSCQSSADSTITTCSSSSNSNSNIPDNSKDQYLKSLNKISHKISKPVIPKKPPFHHHQLFNNTANTNTNSNVNIVNPNDNVNNNQLQPQPQQPHQPPVYNINKNDFRDVVQKLTGSPAHERYSTPTPIHQPKPQSSRLQRIRPPPLAHVSNRPPPLLNSAIPPSQPPLDALVNPSLPFHRPPGAPLSPLPPFPAVHAAAESPVSAYMRYLQNSISAAVDSNNEQFSRFSPLAPQVSPRWNNLAPPPQQQQPFVTPPPSTMVPQPQFQLPTSPLPFGCLNPPRSPHPLLSPGLLLSPSAFPLSPTLPVLSPRWSGL